MELQRTQYYCSCDIPCIPIIVARTEQKFDQDGVECNLRNNGSRDGHALRCAYTLRLVSAIRLY